MRFMYTFFKVKFPGDDILALQQISSVDLQITIAVRIAQFEVVALSV